MHASDQSVAVGADESIQRAAEDGACHVHVLPDYDPTVESYPLVFDRDGPLAIEGSGAGVCQLGHEDVTDGPVLDVVGHGVHTYKRAPTLRNVSVVGGDPGIRLRAAPYASLSNVYVTAAGHGVRVCGGEENCYGATLFNAQAWNCGGDGFRLDADAGPHATQFYGCQAVANRGAGFRLRGYKTALHGGSAQLNHGYGVDVRSPAISIKDAYVEGNGRRKEYPVEIYGKGAHGLTVADCYFHGATPREVWHDHGAVQRGVNLHESASVTVRGCVFRRYGDVFFKGFDADDAVLDRNYGIDGTTLQ